MSKMILVRANVNLEGASAGDHLLVDPDDDDIAGMIRGDYLTPVAGEPDDADTQTHPGEALPPSDDAEAPAPARGRRKAQDAS